jgi:transposase
MEVKHPRCAGIDVHKKEVVVGCRIAPSKGAAKIEIRRFGTMTQDLLELSDWLAKSGITHVAMESTGSYWRPVYNVLEGMFDLTLVNAQHMKNVPGRKTDVKDAEWIADLHAHGLLNASFVPDAEQRGIRDLTRTRSSLVGERARLCNRIQKTLEDANIKLGSVATDVLGVSGRQMLHAMVEGEQDIEKIAQMAHGALRKKIPELRLALKGRVRDVHRFLLRVLLDQVEALDRTIAELNEEIDRVMKDSPNPFECARELLVTAPGVGRVTAEAVLAEIGTDMDQFPSASCLASWAGVCPGNHESAGKRLSGRTRPGNAALRPVLIIIAHVAARQKGTYAHALYKRLAPRRGKKRAIVAVAHCLLIAFYHMLKNGVPYIELGADHFDRLNKPKTVHNLTKRLQSLGYQVTLSEVAA